MKFYDSQKKLHSTRIGALIAPTITKASNKIKRTKTYQKTKSFISNHVNDAINNAITVDSNEIIIKSTDD